MQTWITVDDLNNYIKNYQRILDEIKFLENRCIEIETELTKTGGSIITVTKDQKTNATGITLRQNELFHYLCHYQDGIESLQGRLAIINEYMDYLSEENPLWHNIALYRLQGLSFEQISEQDNIHYTAPSIYNHFMGSIKSFLNHKNKHLIIKS